MAEGAPAGTGARQRSRGQADEIHHSTIGWRCTNPALAAHYGAAPWAPCAWESAQGVAVPLASV